MASFLVESYVPEGNVARFADDVAGLRAATGAEQPTGRPIRYVRSYLVPADEMGFHIVEAGAVADVEQAACRAGIEPERIVEALDADEDERWVARGRLRPGRCRPRRVHR